MGGTEKDGYCCRLKADLKSWVLSDDLKVDGLEQSRICLGRAFQREGAAMEKALAPQVRCLVLSGCERRFASDDRRVREGVWWWSKSVR